MTPLTRETVVMRIAIVSDIHGNRHAFEAVLDVDRRDRVPRSCGAWAIWSATAPSPTPASTWRASTPRSAWPATTISGVPGTIPLEQFSRGAALAATWTQRDDSPRDARIPARAWTPLESWRTVALYHASPRDPVWEYVLSPLQAELCLDVQARAGLADRPFARRAVRSRASRASPATGETRADGEGLDIGDGEWLLNPGSVGQPRDGDPRAAWLELDLDRVDRDLSPMDYDIAGAAAAIRAARLPDSLAERLQYGQ